MANNFLPFNPSGNNELSQEQYEANNVRISGIEPGLAAKEVYNKLFKQTSMMSYALGQILDEYGLDASDNNATALKNALQSAFLSMDRVLVPVLSLAALKAINTALLPNGVMVNCKGLGTFYLDIDSTATPNDTTIVQPTVGIGRWLISGANTFLPATGGTMTGAQAFNRGGNLINYKDVLHAYLSVQTVGLLKITMPKSWSSSFMSGKLRGFQFDDGSSWELDFSSYNHQDSQTWLGATAKVNGQCPFAKVRFAHDGAKCCLLLGDLTTDWRYPTLAITDFMVSNMNLGDWGVGWLAEIIMSESGLSAISEPVLESNSPSNILAKLKTVDGKASGLDADFVRGKPGQQAYVHSDRNLDGVLIKTSLLIQEMPIVIHIIGHPYGGGIKPIDVMICSYFYNGIFYAPGTYGKANGTSIFGLKLMRLDGYYAIWFPKQSYYSGYEVRITPDFKGDDGMNYATELVESPSIPASADLVYEPVIHRTMFGANRAGYGVVPGAWSATGSGYPDYPAWFRAIDTLVKETDQVNVAFAPDYLNIAEEAGAKVTRSENGSFLLLAKKVPASTLYFDYSVVGW